MRAVLQKNYFKLWIENVRNIQIAMQAAKPSSLWYACNEQEKQMNRYRQKPSLIASTILEWPLLRTALAFHGSLIILRNFTAALKRS